MDCSRYSGKSYAKCCEPFHLGQNPPSALELMRSRYSAYALHLADYIMATTDGSSLFYQKSKNDWKYEIVHFSEETTFQNLEILSHEVISKEEEIVVFHATLSRGKKDISFTERSVFKKRGNKWFYYAGEHLR